MCSARLLMHYPINIIVMKGREHMEGREKKSW